MSAFFRISPEVVYPGAQVPSHCALTSTSHEHNADPRPHLHSSHQKLHLEPNLNQETPRLPTGMFDHLGDLGALAVPLHNTGACHRNMAATFASRKTVAKKEQETGKYLVFSLGHVRGDNDCRYVLTMQFRIERMKTLKE